MLERSNIPAPRVIKSYNIDKLENTEFRLKTKPKFIHVETARLRQKYIPIFIYIELILQRRQGGFQYRNML